MNSKTQRMVCRYVCSHQPYSLSTSEMVSGNERIFLMNVWREFVCFTIIQWYKNQEPSMSSPQKWDLNICEVGKKSNRGRMACINGTFQSPLLFYGPITTPRSRKWEQLVGYEDKSCSCCMQRSLRDDVEFIKKVSRNRECTSLQVGE